MVDEKLNEKPAVDDPNKLVDVPIEYKPVEEKQAPGKKTIVILDDNKDVVTLATRFLQDRYAVTQFTEPLEALNFCASAQQPDLLLIDLIMPGMNGVELINELRLKLTAQNKPMPGVIIMTGSENQETLEGLVEREKISLMKKPFRSTELINCVDYAITSQALPTNVLSLLEDTRFLQCAGLDTVGLTISENPYERLAHACNHLKTDFVNYLENYDTTKNPLYLAKAREAFAYFKIILEGLDPEKLQGFDVFKWEPRTGGSTLSEKGVRIFIKRSDTGYHFIRNIYSRKGVPHSVIDNIRQVTSEIFSDAKHRGKFNVPHRFHSPLSEKDCTWSVEEAIMGPDLGYVFDKIRARRNELSETNDSENEGDLLKSLRDALVTKYLEDIKYWQERSPSIKDASISQDPIKLAEYLMQNVAQIISIEKQAKLTFSELERKLWKLSAELFNARNLDLNKDTIVRNLDASPMNAILKIRDDKRKADKLRPSLNEIVACLTDKDGNVSQKEIDNRLYHVDHGFVYTHYLEDFFHLIDSPEIRDEDISSEDSIDKSLIRFRGFVVRSGNKRLMHNKNVFYLMGFYRNLRKVFLTVTEYHDRNVRFRSSEQISGYKFAKDRRKYDEAIKHHVDMAEAYLGRAITRYADIIKRLEKEKVIPQIQRTLINEILNGVNDNSLTLEQTEQGILEIKQRLEVETSSKKYLNNALYLCMSYILSQITSEFRNIKLSQTNGTATKPDVL